MRQTDRISRIGRAFKEFSVSSGFLKAATGIQNACVIFSALCPTSLDFVKGLIVPYRFCMRVQACFARAEGPGAKDHG